MIRRSSDTTTSCWPPVITRIRVLRIFPVSIGSKVNDELLSRSCRRERRSGEKLHSWQYKTSKGFEDKNVLVIGIGNSGGDLVVELGRVAKQVYLSTRRGTWVFNRVGPSGWPADMAMISELAAIAQRKFPRLMNSVMERGMNSRFNHELYGLKPKHRPLRENVANVAVV